MQNVEVRKMAGIYLIQLINKTVSRVGVRKRRQLQWHGAGLFLKRKSTPSLDPVPWIPLLGFYLNGLAP